MRALLMAALLCGAGAAWAADAEADRLPAGPGEEGLSAGASEIQRAKRDSFIEYLNGRYEGAASGYRYLAQLGSMDPALIANLALMLRDAGEPQEAAAHWLKATLLDPESALLWNQRGWNYLALGRLREARDCFRKAGNTAKRPDDAGEASFGLGLTDSLDGNSKAAVDSLRSTLDRNPYLRPAAAAELGRVHLHARRYPQALPFLTMSLSQDPMQATVARDLGYAYDKTGQPKAAWQAYKLGLDLDPNDAGMLRGKKAVEKYITGRPEDALPLVRLARPMFRGPEAGSELDRKPPLLRVAMFSGPDGRPRHLRRFFVMGSTTTRLWDVRLADEVTQAASPFRQWVVEFRVDNRVIEIRDTSGNIIYVTKQPFRFEPVASGYTILLKNPEPTDIVGIDLSDRELRGAVEVIPTPEGFHIVNEVPLEEYLFSVIGQALPHESPNEAYKALAVFIRTKVLEMKRRGRRNPERTDFCDSSHCLSYFGLARERTAGTSAVRETRGVRILLPPGFPLEHHPSCAWATASGIQDRQTPALVFRSPFDLERLVRRYPDDKLYHQASALVPASWERWVRQVDAGELRARVDAVKPVGPILNVRVRRRDQTGRVLSLVVVGTRDAVEITGLPAIRDLLAPGSLRSGLFSVQPLYKGRRLRSLLLWGAGTGDGKGLCIAGTLGQAHLGRDFSRILRHYFTQAAEFVGYREKKKPAVLKPPAKPSAKKKNMRRRPRRRR
ncbi:MAG: SpoIID/LytB domain-containing protein [Elusimicrobiota bacterium]